MVSKISLIINEINYHFRIYILNKFEFFFMLYIHLHFFFFLNYFINISEESSKKHPFPCPCSYRTALTHYLDITCNPRTHIIKELIEYTKDTQVK